VLTNVTLVRDHRHMNTQTDGPKHRMPLATPIAGKDKKIFLQHSHTPFNWICESPERSGVTEKLQKERNTVRGED